MTTQRLSVQQRHRRRARRTHGRVERVGPDPNSYLSEERARMVLQYCRRRAQAGGMRERITLILVESYLYTGLRAIELLGMQLQDIPPYNGHQNTVRISSEFAKRRKERALLVNPKIVTKWEKFCKRYHTEQVRIIHSKPPRGDTRTWRDKKTAALRTPLFVNERGGTLSYWSAYRRLRTVGRNCGFDLRPHILRHTYATQLYEKGGDLRFVQDQLGHSSPAVTQIYAKTVNPRGIQNLQMVDWG